MAIRSTHVSAPDGVRLAVHDAGPPDAPCVLMIHGISQSHLAFSRQLRGSLADRYRVVAFDLRGHGRSDKPAEGYEQAEVWADDVATVIAGMGLVRPIIVGWSFGMVAALDFVSRYGDDGLGGALLLAGPLMMDPVVAPGIIGPGFRDAVAGLVSDDLAEAVVGITRFVENAASGSMSEQALYRAIGYNILVPAHVRRGMFSRSFDHRTTAAALRVPAIYAVGEHDRIIPPEVLAQADGLGIDARVLRCAGHHWFEDEPERLIGLVDEIVSGS